MKPKRALISVWDKTGIVEFAQALQEYGVEIIATGKTAQTLKDAKIKVIEVSEWTGSPEILGGRVKTLHPKIAAGILSYRKEDNIEPIDIVVCNLYPFEDYLKALPEAERRLLEAIELIDIGGVTLLRSAAKNYHYVAPVPKPEFYSMVLKDLTTSGEILPQTRELLALKTFEIVAHYDSVISEYFYRHWEDEGKTRSVSAKGGLPLISPGFKKKSFRGFKGALPLCEIDFPEFLNKTYCKTLPLRYGENPHQRAFFYTDPFPDIKINKLWGKELSYNNLLDIDSVIGMVTEFENPTCAIIKHNTPCGVAEADSPLDAFQLAFRSDSKSAFGGIVGFNREIDASIAKAIVEIFFEVIVAPKVKEEAMAVFKTKKNLRIIEFSGELPKMSIRTCLGGVLIQERDLLLEDSAKWRVVSETKPTTEQLKDLEFAWKVCKFVRSNGIVLAKGKKTIGIGAGQMSRVDAVELAIKKGEEKVKGSVMASDGFFPFRDSIDIAHNAGITAIVEPGGSVRDEEVIKAANEHNLVLLFTNTRHFRH
uniref:Bifunctional purine biosynthesis protein PurH n=1 Tax=candidate division WOR-3 bacterium TaxID=2052148 RepID=A0A7C6AA87_UNCW3